MRFAYRGVLACILSVSLIGLPAFATTAPNPPVGFVLLAHDTVLNGASAVSGTNIYNGDAVVTGPSGQLRLQFAANQIYFSPSSTATLSTSGTGVTALLQSGTVAFWSARGSAVAIRALDVLVHPQTAQPTTAQVTVMAPNELKIASVAGLLSLGLDGHTYTLTPGRTYGVKSRSGRYKIAGRLHWRSKAARFDHLCVRGHGGDCRDYLSGQRTAREPGRAIDIPLPTTAF